MKKTKITELFIFIVSTELVGALAGILSSNAFGFYQELTKTPIFPPRWVFPIVWTILYALMGISVFLIYTSSANVNEKKKAYIIYGMQLFMNFIWSIVFFRLKAINISVAVIMLLIILIFTMIIIFRRIRPAAAYLNIPYLLWTLFAAYLNISISILN